MVGTVVAGRYRLEERIGIGGMGVVYRATQIDADRIVALKILHAQHAVNQRIVKRFLIEMRATARIEHPNTVRLYDFGHTPEGHIFLAMEYLVGVTLSAEMRRLRGPMAPVRVAMLGSQVARGLAAAHAEGIIHRDLKPPNIMICQKYGHRDMIKLLDFGIARFSAPDDTGEPGHTAGTDDVADRLTSPGMVVGTVHFMAPEQIEGRPMDHRVDLYALGCVLFYMATNQAPFHGSTNVAVMFAQVNTQPAVPSSINPDVPPWLDDAILRLLQKDQAKRFQTAADLVVALEEGAGIFSATTDLPPPPRAAAPTDVLLQERAYGPPGSSVGARPSSHAVDYRVFAIGIGVGAVIGALTAALTTLALVGVL